jgi:hypothetical protein
MAAFEETEAGVSDKCSLLRMEVSPTGWRLIGELMTLLCVAVIVFAFLLAGAGLVLTWAMAARCA